MAHDHHSLIIKHIVATSKELVIGRDGGMPWHIPEDFKHFKQTTMGHVIIMGRKTWQSIKKALPGRHTIVVTRSPLTIDSPNVTVASTINEAYNWCRDHQSTWGSDVFIVGGGEIYRTTLTDCQEIIQTQVDVSCEGDTTYPEIPKMDFHQISAHEISTNPKSTVILWKRIQK
jgi:dihydrofolate reductase